MRKNTQSTISSLLSSVRLKMYFTIFILTLFYGNNLIHAQVRVEINTFTAAQHTELATLMQTYITPAVITEHCNTIDLHSDFNFLDFHRVYIQKMEDWLRQQDLGPVMANGTGGFGSKYVPFPKWSQSYALPLPFRVVDMDCPPSSSCTVGVGPGDGSCDLPTNFNPSSPLPDYLSLPVQSNGPGHFNDICDWTTLVGHNGFSRMLEGGSGGSGDPDMNSSFDPDPTTGGNQNVSYHNSGHGQMGGVMWNFRSPSHLGFWLWHAHIDDVWKVWECSCTHPFSAQNIDLYSKDNNFQADGDRDEGAEPSTQSNMWSSPDIWVRNQQDGFSTDVHEDANYDPVNKPYIYVRVRNRGCSPSSGADELKLYWSKSNSNFAYPSYWNGTTFLTNAAMNSVVSGNMVGTKTIPVLGPGESITIRMEWTALPDPDDYVGAGNNGDHHFCLLSRIESVDDPIPATGPSIGSYVVNHNNIAWKNIAFHNDGITNPISSVDAIYDIDGDGIFRLTVCDIINATLDGMGSSVTVGNPSKEEELLTDIKLTVGSASGRTFNEEFETYVSVTDGFYEAWKSSGAQMQGMEELGEWPLTYNGPAVEVNSNKRWFLMLNDKASFNSVNVEPKQMERIYITTTFTPEMEAFDDDEFAFDMVQHEGENILGGFTYQIADPECKENPALNDMTISAGETAVLTPTWILENILYVWSESGDCSENVLSLEPELVVSPSQTTTYTLTTISSTGCITKDDVTVTISGHDGDDGDGGHDDIVIDISVSPNPATETIVAQYRIGNANSVYLEIVKADYSFRQKIEISDRSDELVINLANYPRGIYNIRLIVDGIQEATTNFIKI
jgi:hypothetical protein